MKNGKKSVGNGGGFGTLLTNLSKAFNCLSNVYLDYLLSINK